MIKTNLQWRRKAAWMATVGLFYLALMLIVNLACKAGSSMSLISTIIFGGIIGASVGIMPRLVEKIKPSLKGTSIPIVLTMIHSLIVAWIILVNTYLCGWVKHSIFGWMRITGEFVIIWSVLLILVLFSVGLFYWYKNKKC